jgi:hypothetical protein
MQPVVSLGGDAKRSWMLPPSDAGGEIVGFRPLGLPTLAKLANLQLGSVGAFSNENDASDTSPHWTQAVTPHKARGTVWRPLIGSYYVLHFYPITGMQSWLIWRGAHHLQGHFNQC